MSAPLSFDPIAEAHRQWNAHGWTKAADGMAAVTNVTRVQQIFQGRIDAALRPFALTFARYEVLMLLTFSRKGELPLSKIGARLQVHPASVTNAIDRLEEQELVERRPHPTDRRTTLARITPLGRRRAASATEVMNDLFTDVGLAGERLDELVRLLTEVRANAGDFT